MKVETVSASLETYAAVTNDLINLMICQVWPSSLALLGIYNDNGYTSVAGYNPRSAHTFISAHKKVSFRYQERR